MRADQFRSNPQYVGRMRELLSDPTLAAAIVCVKDESRLDDAPHSADPVESVRRLSWLCGYDQAINLLLSLAQPLSPPLPDEQATFGVDTSQFNFVPPETEPQPA